MPITITHAKSDTIADFTGTVTLFNSSGGTATKMATDIVRPSDWNSNHAATISLTGSEIAPLFNFGDGLSSTTDGSGVTVGISALRYWDAFPLHNTNSTLSAPGIGTWYLDGPYVFDAGLAKGQFNLLVSNSAGFIGGVWSAATVGSVSKYQTLYHHLALYKRDPANTIRLTTAFTMMNSFVVSRVQQLATANTSSGSVTENLAITFPALWDTDGSVTYSSFSTSGSSAFGTSTVVSSFMDSIMTNAAAYLTGARMDIFGMSNTLAPGVYWLAHMYTSTSSTSGTTGGIAAGVMFSTQSRLGLLENAVGAYKQLGKSVSNATTNVQVFHGYLATTTSQASSPIAISDVRATTGRAYWNFLISTY